MVPLILRVLLLRAICLHAEVMSDIKNIEETTVMIQQISRLRDLAQAENASHFPVQSSDVVMAKAEKASHFPVQSSDVAMSQLRLADDPDPEEVFVPDWTDGDLRPPDSFVDFRCSVPWDNLHFAEAKKKGAEAITFDLGHGLFLPALQRGPSDGSAEIAVIVVHGAYRSPGEYLNYLVDPLDNNSANPLLEAIHDRIAIITLAFPDRPCLAAQWLGTGSGSACAPVWSRSDLHYVYGGGADDYPGCATGGITSFEALDRVVAGVQALHRRLRRVVVTGFSAGGQMVGRWAAVSPEGADGRTRQGVELRIVAGGLSTFAYFDKRRPAHNCNIGDRTKTNHTCGDYHDPKAVEVGGCSESYDDFPFGLDCLQEPGKRRSYCGDVGSYVRQSVDSSDVVAALAARFASKDFRVGVGSNDTMNCVEHKCAKWCQAMVQGADRLQRTLNFVESLPSSLEPYAMNYSPFLIIFEDGHSAPKFYATDDFLASAYYDLPPKNTSWMLLVSLISALLVVLLAGLGLYGLVRLRRRSDPASAQVSLVQMDRPVQ